MNKRIIKILSIILLVSLILRFSYVLVHINHDCSHDDNCPICIIIKGLVKDIGYNPKIIELVIIGFIFITSYLINNNKFYDNRYNTLIGLKVKLNN